MHQSIKIYRGDQYIIISEDLGDAQKLASNYPHPELLSHPNKALLYQKMRELESKNDRSILIISENVDITFAQLTNLYTLMEAAGGIVVNENDEILFIYRRGKWDLPKGKMEKNEVASVAAIREIHEETGVVNLTLSSNLGQTYHLYEAFGQKVLKMTHWFHFTCKKDQQLKPQIEEDITKIEWFNKLNVSIPLNNTFGTISDLLLNFQQSASNT